MKLKKCPFCKQNPEFESLLDIIDLNKIGYRVACRNVACKISAHGLEYYSRPAEAAEIWNDRLPKT